MKRIIAGVLIAISVIFIVFMMMQKKPQQVETAQVSVEQADIQKVEEPPHIPTEFQEEGMFNSRYSLDNVLLLASAVKGEGGSQSNETQRAIASVIINRCNASNFPDSISEVIYQRKPTLQYEIVVNGELERYKDIYINGADVSDEEFDEYERCLENVLYVCEVGTTVPENVVYQSPFPQGSGVYDIIDGEYFCYE